MRSISPSPIAFSSSGLLLFLALVPGLIGWFAPAAHAAVLVVLPDGSGDYPTIQAALSVAADGDVIELGDGVFSGPGNADFWQWIPTGNSTDTITMRSAAGDPQLCIIDGGGSGEFAVNGRMGFHVHDLQFRDGSFATGDMGPVPNPPVDLRVTNCIFRRSEVALLLATEGTFTDCLFDHSGVFASIAASFTNCRFEGNVNSNDGGAILAWGSLTVADCVFLDNSAGNNGGAICQTGNWLSSTINISGSIFAGNSAGAAGGAIAMIPDANLGPMDLVITDCTFYGNDAPAGSAVASAGNVAMERCIVAAGGGGTLMACLDSGGANLACCNVFGNAGGDWVGCLAGQEVMAGNFSADPCFCDAQSGDFTLCADSWCLPGNHPWGCDDLVGARGQGCEPCSCPDPVATERQTLGGVKALYR